MKSNKIQFAFSDLSIMRPFIIMIKFRSTIKLLNSFTHYYCSLTNPAAFIYKASRKDLQNYFNIYDKYEALFTTEGLLNISSQKIKQALTTTEIQTIQAVKYWLQGNIQFKDLSAKKIQTLFSINRFIARKENNLQIINLIIEFDSKVAPMLNNYKIQENGIKKTMQIFKNLHKNQASTASLIEDKINQYLDTQENPSMQSMQHLLQQILQYEQFHQRTKRLINKFPLSQIIKLNIPFQKLPIELFKQEVPLLCERIHKQLGQSGFIGLNKMDKIFKLLLSVYLKNKQAFNQMISLIQYILKQAGERKEEFQTNQYSELVLQILSNKPTALILHYLLAMRLPSSKGAFTALTYYPIKNETFINKIILSVIVHKQYSQYKDDSAHIDKEIKAYFKSLDKFLNFYREIKEINLPHFIQNIGKIYHKYFEKIHNPFEHDPNKSYSVSEKAYYVQYLFRVYHFEDKQVFVKKYRDQLSTELITKVVTMHLSQSESNFIPDKYYNFLLLDHFQHSINTQNKKILHLGLNFLIKYRKIGIERTENQYTELKIWNLIMRYIRNAGTIIKINLEQQFFKMITSYISVQKKYYKYDYHYNEMINQLLNIITVLRPFPSIFYLLLKEALSLNLVQSTQITNIDTNKLDQLMISQDQITKLKCIKGENMNAEMLNQKTVQALLVSPFYQDIIIKKEEQIMQILSSLSMQSVFSCLAAYNLESTPQSNKILKLLLQSATKYITSRKVHMINFISIFEKCLKLGKFNMLEYNILWHQIINNLVFRIVQLTFQSHIKLIRYIHTQPKDKINKHLLSKYLNFALQTSKNQVILYSSTLIELSYMIALSDIQLGQKYINFLYQKLIKYNPALFKTTAIELILLIQNRFNNVQIKQILNNFVNSYKKIRQKNSKEYFILDLHYSYLEITNPQFTQKLKINPSHIVAYQFTHDHPLIYSNIVAIICKQLDCKNTILNHFGNNNVVKIKSTLLVFLTPQKNGCLKYQKLLKKMISTVCKDKKISVVLIKYYDASTYESDMLRSIFKQSNLLDRQQYDRLTKLIMKQQLSKQVSEQEVQQQEAQKIQIEPAQITDINEIQAEEQGEYQSEKEGKSHQQQ